MGEQQVAEMKQTWGVEIEEMEEEWARMRAAKRSQAQVKTKQVGEYTVMDYAAECKRREVQRAGPNQRGAVDLPTWVAWFVGNHTCPRRWADFQRFFVHKQPVRLPDGSMVLQ